MEEDTMNAQVSQVDLTTLSNQFKREEHAMNAQVSQEDPTTLPTLTQPEVIHLSEETMVTRCNAFTAAIDASSNRNALEDCLPKPQNQLLIDFRVVRMAGVALLLAGAMVLMSMYFMGDGVTLSTFLSSEKTDADRKQLLDWYNTVSGNVMSLIMMAVDFALELLVVVSLLCLAARWSTDPEAASRLASAVPWITTAALSFLVCNGPTALNVQLVPGAPHVRILDGDLSSRPTGIQFENTSTLAWNPAFSEKSAENPITNSIFRSRFVPTREITAPFCKHAPTGEMLKPEQPMISVAFPPVHWHADVLPTSLESSANYSLLPLQNHTEISSPDDFPAELPLNTTKFLFTAALTRLYALLGGLWTYETFEEFIYDSGLIEPELLGVWLNGTDDLGDPQTMYYTYYKPRSVRELMNFSDEYFVAAMTGSLLNLFGNSSNVMKDEVKADFQYFKLAESVNFTGLTIEIPVLLPLEEPEKPLWLVNWDCSRDGCILSEDNLAYFFERNVTNITEIKPGITMSTLCSSETSGVSDWSWDDITDFQDKSNCSLLIASLGKRIHGQDFDFTEYGDWELNDDDNWDREYVGPHAVVSGLRTTFTLTIGILDWEIEDFATVYNADCSVNSSDANQTGCNGVRAATRFLEAQNKVAVVGQSELQFRALSDFASDMNLDLDLDSHIAYARWEEIVSVDMSPLILLPRNFDNVTEGAKTNLSRINETDCGLNADYLITNVLVNHRYAEESLQMAYTVALHYVLQNGVLHTMSLRNNDWVVDFLGTHESFKVQVSIPLINAIATFVGCWVLVMLTTAAIVLRKRGKRIIEASRSDAVIAEAVLNPDKYPRSMLSLSLDHCAHEKDGSHRFPLDQIQLETSAFGEKPSTVQNSTKLPKLPRVMTNVKKQR